MDGRQPACFLLRGHAKRRVGAGRFCIREARHRCQRPLGCCKVRWRKPVRIRVLSCYHPSLPADRRRAGSCSFLSDRQPRQQACKRVQVCDGVSPLDCMGCGRRVRHRLPHSRPSPWVPQDKPGQISRAVFDYCIANISRSLPKFADDTVIGSQFNQPLLEFSGSLRRLCRLLTLA